MKKLLFNYFLYFSCLLFICFIGISKVFAFEYTYTVVGDIYSNTEQLVSTDYGNAPFTNPRNSGYAFGEVLQVDYIVSNYTFNANTNYQLESHLPSQVFTNVNSYRVSGLNGESCLTSYANSILNNDNYPRWAFQCPHQTNTITITIYNSTGQYLWSGTNIFNWSSAVLWSSSTPMTSSDTNSIINNQNQNTQDIINNQNQNTQDIINNNNQNTQDIINSNKENFNSCHDSVNLFNVEQAKLNSNYSWCGNNSCIQYNLEPNTTYTISRYVNNSLNNNRGWGLGFSTSQNYNNVILWLNNYNTNAEISSGKNTFTTDNSGIIYLVGLYIDNTRLQDYFNKVNVQIEKGNTATEYEEYGKEICKNKLDEQKDAIDNVDDTLKDDNVGDATSEASDFFSDFDTNTFGLTSIITAPLNLIQSLTSSTCSQLELPLPYLDNKKLILPCMSIIYSTYFGTFFTMYQTITYGIIAYWVCVRIFNMVKDFKNPEHDEIEVVDL